MVRCGARSSGLRALSECYSLSGLVRALAGWLGLCAWWGFASAQAEQPLPERVEFNRDIRPILSDVCYQCHGPDAQRREAELRFDLEEFAKGKLAEGRHAIVPGDTAASTLIARITTADPELRMPPPDSGRQLTARQVALLQKWIEQGATWQGHWAFLPPQRPAPPAVQAEAQVKNDIDRFIWQRLEQAGLSLSAEADKATLLRRVTLDLTGLPPTPAEVEAFLNDNSDTAYEKVVDRLLASPHYGERMASMWLDAARYADTSGYQTDGVRHQWRWRDWVINAYNTNLPFDQFTVQQLAGDLLPGATLDQQIASGFNRNHRTNSEGGIVDAEYLVEYVVDRVDTTATVWLGLSFGCARCHDHKYDPLTQKDFYRFYAFFNNLPEQGRVIKYGNSVPMIKSPTKEMELRQKQLEAELESANNRYKRFVQDLPQAQAKWEADFTSRRAAENITAPVQWTITESLAAQLALDGSLEQPVPVPEQKPATPPAPDVVEIPLGFKEGEPAYEAEGRLGQAVKLDGKSWVAASHVPSFAGEKRVSLGIWFKPDGPQEAPLFTIMNDNDSRDNGFAVLLAGDRLRVNFGPRWLDDAIRLETVEPIPLDGWQHVLVTYDGTQLAAGLQVYVNGERVKTRALLDTFTGTFTTATLLRLGSVGEGQTFRGLLDEFRFYAEDVDLVRAQIVATSTSIDAIVKKPKADRSKGEEFKLLEYFVAEAAPQNLREAMQQFDAAQRAVVDFKREIPTTMVMQELPQHRTTHMLIRGEYDKPGEAVEPGVPTVLSPLPEGAPADRLGLAQWLVNPKHPLTARVAVNRFWQLYFGEGLVRTVEDFGSQGQWPTHPELLDYLATEFIRTGWDVKGLQKLIVTSATYRQRSAVTKQHLAVDPENRLLARAPRLRLPAEMIRDQALATSGLLVDQLGGPSVKPYQPAGLWKELANEDYIQEHGAALYRRSMYTYWKRTVPPPTMSTFDAPAREACTLRRSRTNTPLQALALMNDVTYVEAARNLAERILKTSSADPAERVALLFRTLLAREPSPAEQERLQAALQRYLVRYQGDEAAAEKLLAVGESPRDKQLAPAEHAAYTALASLLLNLDETVTRE